MKKPTGEVLRVLKELKEQIDLIQKEGTAPGNMLPMLDQLQGSVNAYLNGEKSPPHYSVVRDVLNRVYINYMSDEGFDDNDMKVLVDFMVVKKVEAVSAQRAPITSAQKPPPLPPRPAWKKEEGITTAVPKQEASKNISGGWVRAYPLPRAEALDIREPDKKSGTILSLQDAMRFIHQDASRLVGAKGDARTLLATAIYIIREDLSKKGNSPDVISARDSMQKLDRQFRESANSNPLNKEKNNQKVRDCIAEINDSGLLEKCYAKEAKVVYSSKK